MWPSRDSHSIKAHKIFKKSDPSRSTRHAHLCLSVSFFSSWNLVLIFHEDQVHVPVNHQARNLVSSIEALQILASALKIQDFQVEHSNLCRLCCFSESETRVEVADNGPSRAELEKFTNKTSSSADEVHVGHILDMRSRSGNISISCISMSFLMFML
ncbi:hypothetical protein WN943_011414 [Citrus x changshan-huyou]